MALFEPIFAALDAAGVRYVVVGGVAVVLHGHARFTADLDIAIDLSPDGTRDAMAALGGLGLRPRLPVSAGDFADPEIRAGWVRERGMQVFSLYDPGEPLRSVDVFVENPIAFEDLWARSEVVELEGVQTRIASIADLIELKRRADRPQDRTDIDALAAIERARKEGQ
jgi:hypothetical protein